MPCQPYRVFSGLDHRTQVVNVIVVAVTECVSDITVVIAMIHNKFYCIYGVMPVLSRERERDVCNAMK